MAYSFLLAADFKSNIGSSWFIHSCKHSMTSTYINVVDPLNQRRIPSANKLRPKASENVKLPDPLPECISKMNQTTELYCSICELSVNSQQQLTQHLGSTKHKLVSLGLLPKPSEDPNIKRVVSRHLLYW